MAKLPTASYFKKLLMAAEEHPHGMLLLIIAGIVACGFVWVCKH